jgi:hypothetical protein
MAFCRLDFDPGCPVDTFKNDVVSVLTGTTDINSLSAYVNRTTSYLISTLPAGWTVNDPDAGPNSVVVRPNQADVTYSPVKLDFGSNNSYLLVGPYESWDAGTNNGTNLAYNGLTTTFAPPVNRTTGFTLYIAATSEYMLMQSVIGGQWGTQGPIMVVMRSPSEPWDSGYPRALFGSQYHSIDQGSNVGGGKFYSPRLKGASSDVTLADAFVRPATPYGGEGSVAQVGWAYPLLSPWTKARDASNAECHLILPISTVIGSSSGIAGFCGPFPDQLRLSTYGFGNNSDTVPSALGDFFVFCVPNKNYSRLLVFQG